MARKKQETLTLFPDIFEVTRKMSDEQFGVLMRAVGAYKFSGEVYSGDDIAVDIAFRTVSGQIDRYAEACEINRNNISSKGGEKPNAEESQRNPTEYTEMKKNDTETKRNAEESQRNPPPYPYPSPYPSPIRGREADKPPTRPRFTPPSVEEVRAYCQEYNYTAVDPDRFVDFYQSKGWKVGKEPMKDWKAAVRGWNSRDRAEPKTNGGYYQKKQPVPMGCTGLGEAELEAIQRALNDRTLDSGD